MEREIDRQAIDLSSLHADKDRFVEWQNICHRTNSAIRIHGADLQKLGFDLYKLFHERGDADGHKYVPELFACIGSNLNDDLVRRRLLIVLVEFLKFRLGKWYVDFKPNKPITRSAEREFDYYKDVLLKFECLPNGNGMFTCTNICKEIECTKLLCKLSAIQQGFLRLMKHYISVEVDKNFGQVDSDNNVSVGNHPWAEVTGTMAARIDIAGGWTDTPPITFSKTNGVVNLSVKIKGKKSVTVNIKKVYGAKKEAIIIRNRQQPDDEAVLSEIGQMIDSSTDSDRFGSLICASLCATGYLHAGLQTVRQLFDAMFPTERVMGLRIRTSSEVFQGSGLGVSSIISACFLGTLYKIMNIELNNEKITINVLRAEQILGTGGGWQDQIGGLYPGLKYSSYSDGKINVENIPINEEFEKIIEKKLVLIYTGQTRLAANVLNEVVYKFLGTEANILLHIAQLSNDAWSARQKLFNGKFPVLECSRYNELKSHMAKNALPIDVEEVFEELQHLKIIETAWMCGAGGGGYACAWLTDELNVREKLVYALYNWNEEAAVYTIEVDHNPFQITEFK
ncbi:hypothetical protein L596_030840 [Steinernema carpocapsae]|uniref:GHMP kinase N-terminal domain-containing protein n=1 Tax=Steinernema carpocapsae TaxID=34508 RepID=A0A4U5LN97_STECR|nr:hypothetical protein L596_030840 [Steinernema carpocapsae]